MTRVAYRTNTVPANGQGVAGATVGFPYEDDVLPM